MKLKAISGLVLGLLLSTSLFAQSLPTAAPEEAGMSSQRLGNIDQLLQDHIDQEKIAGAVALIARKGKVVYQGVMGTADREASIYMKSNTLFRIVSMSKPVTTVAAMILFEEGRFALDDPISWYLPDFKEMKVLVKKGDTYELEPAHSPITVRHLLTQTSGLSYSFTGSEEIAKAYKSQGISDGFAPMEEPLSEWVEKIAKAPLANHPGEGWEYGLNTDVLGRLIEIWSGQLLDEFFRERIFKPLGMQDTYFFIPEEEVPRLAALYRPKRGGGIEKTPPELQKLGNTVYSSTLPYKGPQTLYSGGGGLISTAPDYARFLQMLLNGGNLDGVQVLGPKTIELMTSNQTGSWYPWDRGFGYGFGFSIDPGPGGSGIPGSAGAYQWQGLYYTSFWVDPKEDMFAILLTQLYPYEQIQLREKFRATVYQAIVEKD